MPRTAAQIQAQIDAIEAHLDGGEAYLRSGSSQGTNFANWDPEKLTKLLSKLYQELGRVNGTSPMFARGKTVPR